MAALNLHLTLFSEKDPDLPLRSATPFLRPSQDGSPQSAVFESAAYQDLIQRQPTHPDGPTRGWDLGLNLFGDQITPAEEKSFQDQQIKTKLRRLHIINVVFEILFGIWGMYTAIRYCVAFGAGSDATASVFSLALGIISAIAVGLVITSILLPLFPRLAYPQAWRYARSIIRACYLLLLSAAAATNFALVLLWRPNNRCDWDLDISWYMSTVNTKTSACHPAPVGVWVAAATLRLVMTSIMALLFIYTVFAYGRTRHPSQKKRTCHSSSYFPSDLEDARPVLTSSPAPYANPPLKLTRSDDSNHTLRQSNVTLVKTNSNSTLAPSLSCTGYTHSHSHSGKDISPLKISPTNTRRTSTQTSSHAPSPSSVELGSEPLSQTEPVASSSSEPRMLRRTSRISTTQVSSDTILSDNSSQSYKSNSPTIIRDPSSEIKSTSPWKSSGHVESRKTSGAWESSNAHARGSSQGSAGAESSSTNEGESVKHREDIPVYSYGYGASGPAYPYLDVYNPQRPGRNVGASCEDVGDDMLSPTQRASNSGGSTDDSDGSESAMMMTGDDSSSSEPEGEEEEYVAMMGGFVRRMATIESLGSREAVTTTSMSTGSFVVSSPRSQSPATGSQFSSLRFANLTSSLASSSMGREHPPSTAYWSASSGFTGSSGMRVNERGELLPGHPSSRSSSSYDRQYYTASGKSLPRMDEEDQHQ